LPLEVLFNLRSITGYSLLHLACSLESSENAIAIIEIVQSKLESRALEGRQRKSTYDKNDDEKMLDWLNEYTESSRVQTLA
jgi:ankyrin repeat protein